MRRSSRIALRAVGVALAGASVLVLPAAAAAQPAAPPAPGVAQAASQLTLSVMPTGGFGGVSATLECEPAGGTHPTPDEACASLAAVGGDFDALERADGWLCSANYDPVTVSAFGHWRNQQVWYSENFTNSCEAAVGTDFVFRLGL